MENTVIPEDPRRRRFAEAAGRAAPAQHALRALARAVVGPIAAALLAATIVTVTAVPAAAAPSVVTAAAAAPSVVTAAAAAPSVVTAAAAAPSAFAAAAAAAPACAAYAANAGLDANPGTPAKPFRTLAKLARSLSAGQTGCLRAGETFRIGPGEGIIATAGGTADQPVVITSATPAAGQQRAAVTGQILIQPTAHDITLSGLDFRGTLTTADGRPTTPKSVMINVLGPRVRITGNTITNPYGICIGAGTLDVFGDRTGIRTDALTVDHNTVYGCATSPTLHWTETDSGGHGIYLVNSSGARITDNILVGNKYRGFQSWPKGDASLIANNLFDGNATHVNLGSETAYGFATSHTVVRDNIMLGRVSTWYPAKNPGPIVGNFPVGSQHGNTVTGNCIAATDGVIAGYGMTVSGTVTATPTFVNRAAGDYRLTATSACRGKGPDTIQPTAAPTARQSVTFARMSCAAGQVSLPLPTAVTSALGGEWVMHLAVRYTWDGATWRQAGSTGWSLAWADGDGLVRSTIAGTTSTWFDTTNRAATGAALASPPGRYQAVYQWVYFAGAKTWAQGWATTVGGSSVCRT